MIGCQSLIKEKKIDALNLNLYVKLKIQLSENSAFRTFFNQKQLKIEIKRSWTSDSRDQGSNAGSDFY